MMKSHAGATGDLGRARPVSVDVAAGIVASLVWGSVTFVRLGAARSGALLLIASCGCASLTAVPLAVLGRRLGSNRHAIFSTAGVALLPIAAFAAGVKTKTHHRALGAVTFAVIATFAVAVLYALVRKLRHVSESGAHGTLIRAGLLGVGAVSSLWVAKVLLGGGSPAVVRQAAIDGLVGAAALGVSTIPLPAFRAARLGSLAPATFCVIAAIGVAVASENAPVLAALCERAPLTLGIPGIFGCP